MIIIGVIAVLVLGVLGAVIYERSEDEQPMETLLTPLLSTTDAPAPPPPKKKPLPKRSGKYCSRFRKNANGSPCCADTIEDYWSGGCGTGSTGNMSKVMARTPDICPDKTCSVDVGRDSQGAWCKAVKCASKAAGYCPSKFSC